MKKLLQVLLGASMALAASAQDTAPEKIYIVGSMNSWDTFSFSDNPYFLTDTDGDGTYTGEFNIAANELEFKLFTKEASWDESEYIYGTTESAKELYSDLTTSINLARNDEGFVSNISISNWQGGQVSIAVSLTDRTVKFSAPGQPAAPAAPSTAYLIGEFNSWQTPTADADNGALAMTRTNPENSLTLSGAVTIPAGKADFVIYYVNPEDNQPCYLGYPGDGTIQLTNIGDYVTNISYTGESCTALDQASHVNINNWQGGVMDVVLNPVNSQVSLSSKDAETFDTSIYNDMYLYISCDEENPDYMGWTSLPTITTNSDCYSTYSLTGINWVKFFVANDGNGSPADTNIWGAPEETSLVCNDLPFTTESSLVRGGKAITLKFDTNVSIYITFDYLRGTVALYAEKLLNLADPEHVYLIGTPTGWDNSDPTYELNREEAGVFSATFHIEAEAEFRFFHTLGSWDASCCYGSNPADFYSENAELDDKGVYNGGLYFEALGNWKLTNWEGGRLNIKVNLNESKVTFTDPAAGIDDVTADDNAPAEYYTIDGIRVEAPSQGLYIVRRAGKAYKVIF